MPDPSIARVVSTRVVLKHSASFTRSGIHVAAMFVCCHLFCWSVVQLFARISKAPIPPPSPPPPLRITPTPLDGKKGMGSQWGCEDTSKGRNPRVYCAPHPPPPPLYIPGKQVIHIDSYYKTACVWCRPAAGWRRRTSPSPTPPSLPPR